MRYHSTDTALGQFTNGKKQHNLMAFSLLSKNSSEPVGAIINRPQTVADRPYELRAYCDRSTPVLFISEELS